MRMTLGDWKRYHMDCLERNARHIAERGEDAESMELDRLDAIEKP